MDNRDLFHATMRRENGGALLHMEQGFNVTFEQWRAEGLPPGVANVGNVELTPGPNLYDHCNVAGYLYCSFDQFCIPSFETRVLEENAERRTSVNRNGVTLMERADSAAGTDRGSPPHEIAFTLATPRAYEENRHRLTGNGDRRVDTAWYAANAAAIRAQRDHPVTLWLHGPFAYLRELVGVENAMVLPYTEPDLVRMMLDDHLALCRDAAETVIAATSPDMCFLWEDCCGSTGPFIAPAIFESHFAPWYRAWKDFLVQSGIRWLMLDTDGDPGGLVPAWYGAGVDCMQPWEVNSVDMLRWAEEYPGWVMMGGIYKHMFEPAHPAQVGRFRTTDVETAIDEELARVVGPMRKRGGYIPALDHWAFWGTTYAGYRHYAERLADTWGKANRVTRLG